MLRFPDLLVASIGLAALMAGAPARPQEHVHPAPEQREWLAAHNSARAEVGLAPLAWSERLARDAQGWARHLARNDHYEHASPDQRKGQGENLWRGPHGYWSAWEKVGFFLAEKRHFRPGRFPEVSRTGRWSDVGHYTQVIWPETREVGCAAVRAGPEEVLVCRYWPAGNVWGQRIDPPGQVARR